MVLSNNSIKKISAKGRYKFLLQIWSTSQRCLHKGMWLHYSVRIKSSDRFTTQHTCFLKSLKIGPIAQNPSPHLQLSCMLYTLTFSLLPTLTKLLLILALSHLAKPFNKIKTSPPTLVSVFIELNEPDISDQFNSSFLFVFPSFDTFHRPAVHHSQVLSKYVRMHKYCL